MGQAWSDACFALGMAKGPGPSLLLVVTLAAGIAANKVIFTRLPRRGGRLGNERRLVLGHSLWWRSFAGDAEILGRTVIVDGESRSSERACLCCTNLPTFTRAHSTNAL